MVLSAKRRTLDLVPSPRSLISIKMRDGPRMAESQIPDGLHFTENE